MDLNQLFIFYAMFAIVVIFIIGVFIFCIISGIKDWSKNNASPILNVNAKVVGKRLEISGGRKEHRTSTWYYVTFEVDSGDRLEFYVDGREYGQLIEGDQGELCFQGTRYHSFTRY